MFVGANYVEGLGPEATKKAGLWGEESQEGESGWRGKWKERGVIACELSMCVVGGVERAGRRLRGQAAGPRRSPWKESML